MPIYCINSICRGKFRKQCVHVFDILNSNILNPYPPCGFLKSVSSKRPEELQTVRATNNMIYEKKNKTNCAVLQSETFGPIFFVFSKHEEGK